MGIIKIIVTTILILFVAELNQGFAQKKIDKKYTKFQEKAMQINKLGGIATVGIGIEDIGRPDYGKRKAIAAAAQEMSENQRNYIEATTQDFKKAVGVGLETEHNDVFENAINFVSSGILKGCFVADFDFYITKANKINGTATFIVLYVVSPEQIYHSISNELKATQETLYQRYINSDFKKLHDENIKAFRKEFENNLLNDNSKSNQKRLALIIGNGIYEHGGLLANPENDARAISEKLSVIGFIVLEYVNLDQKSMKIAIDEFGEKLKNYDVGLFFYAGHGVQVNGNNYLIPCDAKLDNEKMVEYNCVRANRVLGRMETTNSKTNIVILDACRDNPFERSWNRGIKGMGLATMNAPFGSIIAYATSPGQTASDGYDKNSPYTSALIEYIIEPNITIIEMFQHVRKSLKDKTEGRQLSWESTSLEDNFYFVLNKNESRETLKYIQNIADTENESNHKNIDNTKMSTNIKYEEFKKGIPASFTPNEDNNNDEWLIPGIELFPGAEMEIFDRWGGRIFKSDIGYTKPWDGNSKGKDLPMGTYYYIIDLKNGHAKIKGDVVLIR